MKAHEELIAVSTTSYTEMSALVRIGLLEFWARALPEDAALLSVLREEAEAIRPPGIRKRWETVRDRIQQQWPLTEGPLGRLIQDYELSLRDTFLLTLIGEVESSHRIGLVISELQAPARNARPSVHFCVALMEALFDGPGMTTLDLASSAMIRHHLVSLSSDGPVPLRSLSMSPDLWSIFRGVSAGWPSCEMLSEPEWSIPEDTLQQLPGIAAMLASENANGRSGRGILLRGHPNSGRGASATTLARLLDLKALEIPADTWRQQPELRLACRYAGWLPVVRPDVGPGEVWKMPESRRCASPIAIILGTDGAVDAADLLELEVNVPSESQRLSIWRDQLQNDELACDAAAVALLSAGSIVRIATNARLLADRERMPLSKTHIAEARQRMSAARLRLLAQPVSRRVGREALVVPAAVTDALDNLILRARRRESLWQGLGKTLQSTPNAGVRALFVGESGTGKTLAASYISTSLSAPLYRVDLSVVMNKYIGESEKNLAQLLDHAAANDVVLLFDEADSLFGSRSEGRETGERYANMLTNFLLTRIENHPGVVILTTNSRERIDNAFNRRLDVVIEFPLPGYEERLHLWKSHLGDRGPGEETYRTLASYCDMAGGQLRNVVISAAARAAGRPIQREDLLMGLRIEYRKVGRELPARIERILAGS